MKHTAVHMYDTEWFENNEDRIWEEYIDLYDAGLREMKEATVQEHQDGLQAMIDNSVAAGWDNEMLVETYGLDTWFFEETFMVDFLENYHQRRHMLEHDIMAPLLDEVRAAYSEFDQTYVPDDEEHQEPTDPDFE